MTIYYSNSPRGFYDDRLHGDRIPLGAKPITRELHQDLITGQALGKLIREDAEGNPVLVDPPTPTRTELEERAWTAIKAERDRRTQQGGYQAQGHWFHSDTFSRSQWLGLKDQARDVLSAGGTMADALIKLGSQVLWKSMAGDFVPVTAQLAFDVVAAAGDSDARIFAAAEVHRASMLASADPAAYDHSAGWPLIYGE